VVGVFGARLRQRRGEDRRQREDRQAAQAKGLDFICSLSNEVDAILFDTHRLTQCADNLVFNPANFTPFTSWVAAIAASVKAAPEKVIDCAASQNASSCLADKAKAFVRTAFRGTPTDAQLTRFADFFTSSAAAVGVPAATADLVDVTLTSPSFVYRDEVLADTSGMLQPAEHLQHITYTLADAPPETVGLSSATPGSYVQTADQTQKTIDQVLASPQARDKLMRFFLAWLEVREPDEFTISTTTFPEFTPTVAAGYGRSRTSCSAMTRGSTPNCCGRSHTLATNRSSHHTW